ncbi:MAG: hypothetical protein GYB68_19830 [Chloroflexi bacterium]|nr:hypothetical protein [Chloroflexota bacterium]
MSHRPPPETSAYRRALAMGLGGPSFRYWGAFGRARSRAFLSRLLARFRWYPEDLLSFEEVRQQLRLEQSDYRGVQAIPVDKIVGSIARYEDFNRTFLPRRDNLSARWGQIEKAMQSGGVPPIEVYKVGGVYFVKDGNHRVSVARQIGMTSIEAHVFEYSSRVPLWDDDDQTDILIRGEYLDFLEMTRLDVTRPGQHIMFTSLGGYRTLEMQIGLHRHILERQQGQAIGLPEAAAHWYDSVYIPITAELQRQRIMDLFPGRSTADLMGWMIEWADWRAQSKGETLDPLAAVQQFVRHSTNPLQRLYAQITRLMGWPILHDTPDPRKEKAG